MTETYLGFVSRALDRTLIVKLKHGLALANVRPAGSPSGINIVDEQAEALATVYRLDRADVIRRLHAKTTFDQLDGKGVAAIDFFGTKVRIQYLETMYRRVSPRALAISPHHRAIWDFRPFSFDPVTRERLLGTCPVCGQKLRWVYVRGPTHCDVCVTHRGLPKTDLRDYPQPTVEFVDEEAIDFVVGLVDLDPKKREAARKLFPPALVGASNSDVFEAVMSMSSCFPRKYRQDDLGRPPAACRGFRRFYARSSGDRRQNDDRRRNRFCGRYS